MIDNETSLSNRGFSHVADALGIGGAIVAAVGAPGVGAIATALGTVASTCTRVFEKRQSERREEQTKVLVQALAIRLKNVEAREIDESEVDLFGEMFLKAVAEEDKRKTVFHGAFISWMVRAPRKPSDARLLGEAIARLSFEELRAFVKWGWDNGGFRGEIYLRDSAVSEDVFYHRLDFTGLMRQGGIRSAQFFSTLGREFVEECRGEELG